ncbi:MAG: hypothetical protein MJZ08_02140 [Bacteroidaceae bacterium]|nr:hypothetical protein [Bacteroidaceae bacterium]
MKKTYIEPKAKEVKFFTENLLIVDSLQGEGDETKEVLSKDYFDDEANRYFGW